MDFDKLEQEFNKLCNSYGKEHFKLEEKLQEKYDPKFRELESQANLAGKYIIADQGLYCPYLARIDTFTLDYSNVFSDTHPYALCVTPLLIACDNKVSKHYCEKRCGEVLGWITLDTSDLKHESIFDTEEEARAEFMKRWAMQKKYKYLIGDKTEEE